MNASMNFYMFYGGTNFGWLAGANPSPYQPNPTSYDHDAPLTEAGDMTWKYKRIRDVISKYRTDIPSYDVKNTTKIAYGNVTLEERARLFDILDELAVTKKQNDKPMMFEDLDNDYGFVMYETETAGGWLEFGTVNDRVSIFVDRKPVDTLLRDKLKKVQIPAGKLQLLVEHLGRINVGWTTVDKKGIAAVKLDGKEVTGWTMYTLPLSNIDKVKFTKAKYGLEPVFYRTTFEVNEVADTFLNPTGLQHGIVFINGVNLGRYWLWGPQLTVYVPAPYLKKGTNELIIFEVDSVADIDHVSFDDTPQIDSIPHTTSTEPRKMARWNW